MKHLIARIRGWIGRITESRSQREEVVFFVVGIILSLGVLILFIVSISFLAERIDTALDIETTTMQESAGFHLDELSDLGIGNPSPTETP